MHFVRGLVFLYALICAVYMMSVRAFVLLVGFVLVWWWWSIKSKNTSLRRQEFRNCTLCCLLPIYALLALTYAWVGSTASTEEWALRVADSPVNRSSCSRTADQTELPYHPLGYVEWTPDVYETLVDETGKFVAMTFCALPEGSAWASSNGAKPQGYRTNPNTGVIDLTRPCDTDDPTCPGLASTLAEDYPDLGVGLRAGKRLNSIVTDLAYCQGVRQQPARTSDGRIRNAGEGLEICSQCMAKRPDHCKTYDGDLFCFLCPGGYFSGEPVPSAAKLRRFATLLIIMCVLLFVSSCYAFPPAMRSRAEYSPLF